ncbi:MAG: GntR family transcriptional regulator [Alphaproteobacteria bacterium]
MHDELLSRLRKLIIDGEIEPGAKIPEKELCKRFGVSRTPLREAIKVIAAEGLVRLEPHRGAVVIEPTLEEIEECLPISSAIEALSGELACEHITDEEIAAIKALHDKMIAAHKSGDHEAYASLIGQIHKSIIAAARNPLLTAIYDATYFRIGKARMGRTLPREIVEKALAEHDAIIQALASRDSKTLGVLLQKHVERLFKVYWEALQKP